MATTQEKISSTSELAPGDLPDPLDLPSKTPASGDADEIISQLASNQIEKMLADANVESAEAVIEEPSAIVNPAPTTIEPESSEPSDEHSTSDEHSSETTAEEFSKILSDEPASFNHTAPIAPAEAVEQAMADMQSAAEELARELEADRAVTPNRHSESSEPVHQESRSATGVRVGFNILSAINSPFQNLSDNTRELLGSIAIITLVNAMSILLYVMIYR